MTTTIGADGPLYVGPPYVFASFDGFVTVLHVLVVGVFALSLVTTLAAAAALEAFDRRRECGRSRASVVAVVAMVASFVTGASTAAWAAAGPDVGLLTVLVAGGCVVAVGWYTAWRQRRSWAPDCTAQSAAGAEERL